MRHPEQVLPNYPDKRGDWAKWEAECLDVALKASLEQQAAARKKLFTWRDDAVLGSRYQTLEEVQEEYGRLKEDWAEYYEDEDGDL